MKESERAPLSSALPAEFPHPGGWGPPPGAWGSPSPDWIPPNNDDWNYPHPEGTSPHPPTKTTTKPRTRPPTKTTTPAPRTCNCNNIMSCVCPKLLGDVPMEDLNTVAQTPDQKHLCSFMKKHKCGASLEKSKYTPRSSKKKMPFCRALKNFYNFVSV